MARIDGHGLWTYLGSTIRVLLIFLLLLPLLHLILSPSYSSSSQISTNQRVAYATVVCGEQNAKAAMVLVHSIRSTKTPFDIVVLTKGLSAPTKHILAALGAVIDPPPGPLLDNSRPGIGSYGVMNESYSEGSCLMTKMRLWGLTQYDTLVYADRLMVVLENIDDLFKRRQLSASPDNDLPDRFSPNLMVLEPSQVTLRQMVYAYENSPEYVRVTGAEDLLFFNYFFEDWPLQPPENHLEFGYNAPAKLGYSATWNEWVHTKLKAVHFDGPFERWNEIWDKLYPPTRRYDHIRWEILRDMYTFLVQQGVVLPSDATVNPDCQTDYMQFARGSPVQRKASILLRFRGNLNSLRGLLQHLSSLRLIYEIYVLPTSANAQIEALRLVWNGSKPVTVLNGSDYSPSAFLRPIASLATDCLILSDDTVKVNPLVLQTAIKLWMQHPHRMVGLFPMAHYRRALTGELVFVGQPRTEYSMVGTKLLVMHPDYLQSYTCTLPQAVKEYVDRMPSCADIALNMLATQLTNTPPLLVIDGEKRIMEEDGNAAAEAERTRLLSSCLNDLEAMLGNMGLQNTTEAKMYMEHDEFTKEVFHDPNSQALAQTPDQTVLDFQPIFEPPGKIASTDENFRFMSQIQRIISMPEVIVMPSPLKPKQVLCVQGNSSVAVCRSGANCTNQFALTTFRSVPSSALLLLGTTVVLHSRYGFDDRFHTPNILANLFYPYPDYGFMKPARALFYRRGSLEMKVSQWSRLLFKALLGDHIAPFRLRNGDRPVCFERAVMTRRYRPMASERNIVLREAQERAWAYCGVQAGLSDIPVSGMTLKSAMKVAEKAASLAASWAFTVRPKSTTRILLLHGDVDTGYGVVENLNELVSGLRLNCRKENSCELLVLGERNFTNFCQQVLHMGSADLFISVAGDGTMNHIMFMQQGKRVLELVPFGLRQYDPRVLKVYQEASRWVGLEHHQLFEKTGPSCPADDSSCRFLYRKRAMHIDVDEVLQWWNSVRVAPTDGTAVA